MSQENYYTPPTDKVFNEIKEASIAIWKTYDDQFGYATEKINNIKDLKNIQDNAMYMVAMFDIQNQRRLFDLISDDAVAFILDRRGY